MCKGDLANPPSARKKTKTNLMRTSLIFGIANNL